MKYLLFVVIVSLISQKSSSQDWQLLQTTGNPVNRHECATAIVKDAMYMLGGRGKRPINRYTFASNTWDSVGTSPMQFNHFQAVSYNDEIFIAGAMIGSYPHETPVPEILAYKPGTNTWRTETIISENRRRGGAGCIIYNNKLYLVCGIKDGHYDGHVTWVDEYDFATKQWRQLPDAPHARDHFQAVLVGNKMYAVGGRKSSAVIKKVFELTVPEVDVFDFKTSSWATLDSTNNIPTPRAGCTAVTLNSHTFMVIGGESGAQKNAHNQAEIFDTKQNKWTKTILLTQGRHGTQAQLYKGIVYIAAGAKSKGGGDANNELNLTEYLTLKYKK